VKRPSPARQIHDLIEHALAEDLATAGDITSAAIFSPSDIAAAVIKSKATGVLSGTFLLQPLFTRIDPTVTLTLPSSDGDRLEKGSEICRLAGSVQSILAGERIALNFLQHLSGIASATAQFASAIAHTRARLLDTRKTTPGLRFIEKMAVRHGGGTNHRSGLFDMMLIKDTHVKRAGGVTAALSKALAARAGKKAPAIEVEVQSVDECVEALALCPDRIMLDNMELDDMRRCVDMVRLAGAKVELEASGGVTRETIVAIAETGVDFISCGAITHSAPALDIHLVIVE